MYFHKILHFALKSQIITPRTFLKLGRVITNVPRSAVAVGELAELTIARIQIVAHLRFQELGLLLGLGGGAAATFLGA